MEIRTEEKRTVKQIVSELISQYPGAPKWGKQQLKRHYTKLITKYTHYETNPHFEYMVDYIEELSEKNPEIRATLIYDRPVAVGTKEYFTSTVCYFGTNSGIFGFCPKGNNEIYIVRVEIQPGLQGKGLGTGLMTAFLDQYLTFKGDPSILTLVVTGSVGMDENRQESDIERQKKFFQKFGFVQTSHWFSPVLPQNYTDGGVVGMTMDIEKCFEYMKGFYEKHDLTKSDENDTIEYDDKNK